MRRVDRSKRFLAAVLSGLVLTPSLLFGAYASEHEDDTPPVLHFIAVSRETVYAGESVTVSAGAEDDDSGVQWVAVRFRNAESGDLLSVKLLPNSDEEIAHPYSGQLKIPKESAPGTYTAISSTAIDWEGNHARYNPEGRETLTAEMQASFTVRNPGGVPAPAPTGCRAESAGTGVSIQFSVTAAHAVDKATLLFENSENHRKLSFTLKQEDGRNGTFANRFALPMYEPPGTFTLKKVTLQDTAGTKTTYTTRDDPDQLPLNISASFAVRSAHTDREAPTLRSVAVGKPVWTGEEARVRLRVEATDDWSGIEHITVKFQHMATGKRVSKVLRAADSENAQSFVGELALQQDDRRGSYQLDSVTLADHSGNRRTYCHPDDAGERKEPLAEIPAFEFE